MTSADDRSRTMVLTRLAKVLSVEPGDLAMLDAVPTADLVTFRDAIVDRLIDDDRARLQGVVTASRLVPTGLAATIAERRFGAPLCARMVSVLPPARAVEFAGHMAPDFMASITSLVDPRVAGVLATELPFDTVRAITRQLQDRQDLVTLASFVGHVPPPVVARILADLDDHVVLQVAASVEQPADIPPVVAELSDDHLDRLLLAAAQHDLWDEVVQLFRGLPGDELRRALLALDRADTGVQDRAITVALAIDDPGFLADIVRDVGPAARARLVALQPDLDEHQTQLLHAAANRAELDDDEFAELFPGVDRDAFDVG